MQQQTEPPAYHADAAVDVTQEEAETSTTPPTPDNHPTPAVSESVLGSKEEEAEGPSLADAEHQPSSSVMSPALREAGEAVQPGTGTPAFSSPIAEASRDEGATTAAEGAAAAEEEPSTSIPAAAEAVTEPVHDLQEEGRPRAGYFQDGLRVSHVNVELPTQLHWPCPLLTRQTSDD
jgi:hypothetical protein